MNEIISAAVLLILIMDPLWKPTYFHVRTETY